LKRDLNISGNNLTLSCIRFGIAALSQSAVLFGGKTTEDPNNPKFWPYASVYNPSDNSFTKIPYYGAAREGAKGTVVSRLSARVCVDVRFTTVLAAPASCNVSVCAGGYIRVFCWRRQSE
jgi:hypothetical protein